MRSLVVYRLILMSLTVADSGCFFGPRDLEKTHGLSAAAAIRVDEEQFLMNVVRLRYVESSLSLDVNSIAAQLELSASAEARPFFSTEATGDMFRAFLMILPFAGISGANRPMISMSPSDDASSVRQFLAPISTITLVVLSQLGWPVSDLMRV